MLTRVPFSQGIRGTLTLDGTLQMLTTYYVSEDSRGPQPLSPCPSGLSPPAVCPGAGTANLTFGILPPFMWRLLALVVLWANKNCQNYKKAFTLDHRRCISALGKGESRSLCKLKVSRVFQVYWFFTLTLSYQCQWVLPGGVFTRQLCSGPHGGFLRQCSRCLQAS